MAVDLVRDAAVDVLLRVFDRNVNLDVSLDKTLRRKKPSDRGRRFMTNLVYGTVRHKQLCDHALKKLCHQPLEKLPLPILVILRMAVFQSLFCENVTHPAMVHTSVDLAKRRGHAGLARMVNAVLRRAPQNLDEIALPDSKENYEDYLGIRYSLPSWLVTRWVQEYGAQETEILAKAINTPALPTLRANTLKTSVKALLRRLNQSGFSVVQRTPIPDEITLLESKKSIIRSKCFLQGHCMLQDPASMASAHLLEPQPGERVLDMCAAPGGKTTHMAQLSQGEARITAMDRGRYRLERVRENVERMEIPSVELVCGDGLHPPFAEAQFDAVLLDAPCSGLGTLRRHPDLKWRMDTQQIARLAKQQRALLRSAIAQCRVGGRIVYSVCTITPEETYELVQEILQDMQVVAEDGPEFLDSWKRTTGQYQILPSNEALDGFFLTRLRKVS